MITVFTIILLVLIFKLTIWVFKVCGKIIGVLVGFAGSLIISVFVLAGIGMTIAFVPVIIVALMVSGALGLIARVTK